LGFFFSFIVFLPLHTLEEAVKYIERLEKGFKFWEAYSSTMWKQLL